MLWQELLVSNIQENLECFKFYVTNLNEYIDQEIQLVVNRMDFMYNSYLRQHLVQQNIAEYVNLIRSFTLPKNTNSLNPEYNWKIANHPMIIVYLKVNTSFKRKKEKKSKKDDKKKEYALGIDEVEEEKVFYLFFSFILTYFEIFYLFWYFLHLIFFTYHLLYMLFLLPLLLYLLYFYFPFSYFYFPSYYTWYYYFPSSYTWYF